MTNNAPQRNYIRLKNSCPLTFKFLDSELSYQGHCTSLSGSGLYFTTEQAIATGKALIIHIPGLSKMMPDMTAFVEVIRSTPLDDQLFEIDGTIQSIKAN